MGINKNHRFVLHIFDEYFCISENDSPKCLVISRDFSTSTAENDTSLNIAIEDTADIPFGTGRFLSFYAIFGIYWLLKGPYLAIVTKAKLSTTVKDSDIREVAQVDFILIPTTSLHTLTAQQEEDEKKYIKMIQYSACSSSLYFAYDFDITHTIQRISELKESTMTVAERADPRFCWNYPALSALIGRRAYPWIVPIAQLHVEFVKNCSINSKKFDFLYISRRSRFRQGTRFTMRGIDSDGNVANFVESEQVCFFHDGSESSFVQIRGSIPIYWSSPVTMKYAPKVYQRNNREKDLEACKRHLLECNKIYGRVLLINLIDKKTEQLRLGTAFKETIAELTATTRHFLANVRYVWFDFHHECRKMKWYNLEKLVKLVDDDFQDSGYFATAADGRVTSRQSGVLRTNCMDNLDRTNVVQSLFGRRSLLLQVGEIDAIRGNVLDSPFPEFEKVFKNAWGNNADAISTLYAGTGALKTDFTRTGKRTTKGAIMDGWNSCVRYVLNNFYDGYKQDAMDLLLRKYIPVRTTSHILLREGQETLESFLIKLIGIAVFLLFIHFITRSEAEFHFFYLLKCVTIEIIVLLTVCIIIVVKKGTFLGQKFVTHPSLRPLDGCRTSWKRK